MAATDATTSDAGITTSVTGNSSPVTERTTEDELPSGRDDRIVSRFRFVCLMTFWRIICRSAQELSASSVPPRVAPVRPLLGDLSTNGSHGMIMRACRLTGTRRAMMTVVGARQKSPAWVFHPLCHCIHQLNPLSHVP
jgi:hypothetical protein